MAWWRAKTKRALDFGAYSDIGQVRRENQDTFGCFPRSGSAASTGYLFIVADGMGGHARGREASQIAVDTVQRVYFSHAETDPSVRLKQAFDAANQLIFHMSRNGHQVERMGTTCTALAIEARGLFIAHVGDSRAYRITPERIEKLTRDHTVVEELRNIGVLSEAEALQHPRRNALLKAMGVEQQLAADIEEFGLCEPGEIYLLCSDGLAGISDPEIQDIVQNTTPQEASEKLVRLANERGGKDNITVLVVRVF